MEARGLAPVDVMKATDQFNVFLPTGSVKVGDTDYAIDSNSLIDIVDRMGAMPLKAESGNVSYIRDVASPKTRHSSRPMSCESMAADKSTSPSIGKPGPARWPWSTNSRAA